MTLHKTLLSQWLEHPITQQLFLSIQDLKDQESKLPAGINIHKDSIEDISKKVLISKGKLEILNKFDYIKSDLLTNDRIDWLDD
jgi:hypothetical protein